MNALFDSELKDLIGKVMVLATNDNCSAVFKPLGNVLYFKPDNTVESVIGHAVQKWNWSVNEGYLILSSSTQTYLFDSLEVRNGVVYAVAKNPEIHNNRIILYAQNPLNLENLGICVSSHVQFVDTAVPKLLKSLGNTPFGRKKVVVVVADSKEPSVSEKETGEKMVFTRKNMLGFTALSETEELTGADHWLLLHDTCEVVPDFLSRLAWIDVGLNPDIVTFSEKDERLEIGVYSDKFAKKAHIGDIKCNAKNHLSEVHKRAEVILDLSTALKKLPPKDIYGEGVKRETVLIGDAGIRKFRGKTISGGRP